MSPPYSIERVPRQIFAIPLKFDAGRSLENRTTRIKIPNDMSTYPVFTLMRRPDSFPQ
jgi:hypothetical protein